MPKSIRIVGFHYICIRLPRRTSPHDPHVEFQGLCRWPSSKNVASLICRPLLFWSGAHALTRRFPQIDFRSSLQRHVLALVSVLVFTVLPAPEQTLTLQQHAFRPGIQIPRRRVRAYRNRGASTRPGNRHALHLPQYASRRPVRRATPPRRVAYTLARAL